MPDSFGLVYEVTHIVDREIIADFDAWLGQHIEEMLAIEGISRVASFSANDSDDGRPRRVSQYHFDSDADLENYLAGPARFLRQAAEDSFGGRFTADRRVLHQNEVIDGSLKPAEVCLNCGTTLTGQYCGDCGQRATTRLISVWQLLREAFGDLLEIDSRIWRTLIPLTVRPGKLTRDYLEGRRARFMPPFRTYLVLSIIFFLVAFFDPREEFGILFGPESDPAGVVEETGAGEGQAGEPGNEGAQLPSGNGDALPGASRMDPADGDVTTEVPVAGQDASIVDQAENDKEDDAGFNIHISNDETTVSDDCDEIEGGDLPPWLATRLTPERLKAMCERVVADDGQAWARKLLDSVPAALIALLPLMALVLKALYPLSKRYYVEHVLFVIHFHAFIFLILSLQVMFSRLVSFVSLPDVLGLVTSVAVSLYIPAYLFKAMRRVYDQRWLSTAIKYVLLLMTYFGGLLGILGATALIAAFSI